MYPYLRRTGRWCALLLITAGCAGTQPADPVAPDPLQLARAYSAENSGDALLVWIGDELVLEDYAEGYDPDTPHILTEASTLLTGLLALAAVDDGLIRLDDPVSQTLTEWQADPQKATVTISQLLHLVGGLPAGHSGSVPTYEKALTLPLVHPPGEAFRFGPAAFQVFGALMNRKVGPEYLGRRILEPLGIPGERWLAVDEALDEHRARGTGLTPRRYDGAHLTAAELGRIGLLLRDGRWNGQVLLKDLGPLTRPEPASPGYGLTVWLNAEADPAGPEAPFLERVPEHILLLRRHGRLIYSGAPPDLFMAAGRYNQRLYVIPSLDLVIVRLGRENPAWDDGEFLARLLEGRSLYPQPPQPLPAGETRR